MRFRATISASVKTDKGLIRNNNEDNFNMNGSFILKGTDKDSLFKKIIGSNLIFAVCDGMGGENSGEEASFEVVKSMQGLIKKSAKLTEINIMIGNIKKFIDDTNLKICNMSSQESENMGMGTTFVCLAICNGCAAALNMGDSRIYILRQGRLKQLSIDHTESEMLVRLGIINKEQAQNHKGRHVLMRHFGVLPEYGKIEADISNIIDLKCGDIFLLCSDGLTDMVDDKEIERILNSDSEVSKQTDLLVEEALKSGGTDNVTAMVLKIERLRRTFI